MTIEVVKKAIDGDGTILRLYETDNRRGKVRLHVSGHYAKAWETTCWKKMPALDMPAAKRVLLTGRTGGKTPVFLW